MASPLFNNPVICALHKNKDHSFSIDRLSMTGDASEYCINLFERASSKYLSPFAVEYSPEYKLDSDQIFVIKDFPLPSEMQNVFRNTASLKTYSMDNNLDVVALASSDSKSIAFQKIDRGQHLSKKFCLLHDGDTFHKNNKAGIIVKESINCLYHENDLYFWSYYAASQIFDMKKYYEVASDTAVRSFLNSNLLSIEDEHQFYSSLNHEMRRRVVIIDKIGVLNHDINYLVDKAKEKDIPVVFENEKLVIPKDKNDLKITMGFLTDKIFRSIFTNDLCYTNSVQNLSKVNQ